MSRLLFVCSVLSLFVLTTACDPNYEIPGDPVNCDWNSIIPDLNDSTSPEGRMEVTVSTTDENGRPLELFYNLKLPTTEQVVARNGDFIHIQFHGSDFNAAVRRQKIVLDTDYSCDLTQDFGAYERELGTVTHDYEDTSPIIRCAPVYAPSVGLAITAAVHCNEGGYNVRGGYKIYQTLENYANQSVTYLLEIKVVDQGVTILD